MVEKPSEKLLSVLPTIDGYEYYNIKKDEVIGCFIQENPHTNCVICKKELPWIFEEYPTTFHGYNTTRRHWILNNGLLVASRKKDGKKCNRGSGSNICNECYNKYQ